MNRNTELIATGVVCAAIAGLFVLTDASGSLGGVALVAALVLGVGAFAIRRWVEATRLERELQRQIDKGTEAEQRLRESAEFVQASETRLREAQRVARMGDYTRDLQTGEITLSDGVLDLLGYDPDEKIDYAWIETEIRHPDDRERVTRWLDHCVASGSDRLTPNEYRVIRKDGSVIWVRNLGEIERGDEGTVRVFGTLQDITERKRAEEGLLAAKNFAENLVETANAIVVVLDRSGEIRVFNKAAEEITGYTREELSGRNWFDVIVPRERYPEVWDEFQRLATGGIPEKFENPILTKDGRERHIVWRNSEWKQAGQFHGTVSFGVDITDRKNAEAALENSERRLRALSTRLQSIREEECERIARELHDELGQALTVLKFDLASLVRKLGGKSADGGVEALMEKAESMVAFVDETIQVVRSISTELRPRVLDDAGLIQALEWQAREFERRTEIRCAFTSEDSELTLDRERSTAMFRIFQEILTNVARHAAARNVEAVLRRGDGRFELVVRDDGRGITDDDIARSGSLGIVGMRERAHAFGGEVRLEGRIDEGTVVTVHIPVERTGVRRTEG